MTVSSFPEPQVMWHLNSNKMVLRPGESADNGEYYVGGAKIKSFPRKIQCRGYHDNWRKPLRD